LFSAYDIHPNESCLRPLRQTIRFAWVLALAKAGSKTAINNAIIAITTNSSTNVNPSSLALRWAGPLKLFLELRRLFIIAKTLLSCPVYLKGFIPSGILTDSHRPTLAPGGTITLYSFIYQIPAPKTTANFSIDTEILAHPARVEGPVLQLFTGPNRIKTPFSLYAL
jgi:hypothetical protein